MFIDFFKTYGIKLKLSLFSLVLFSVLLTQLFFYSSSIPLMGKTFATYHFKSHALGFFASDLSFFRYTAREEAEKKMVQSFPTELQEKVQKVIRPVLVLCEKYQVDPYWVLAVMWTESHFKNHAKSKKGAHGLMQIMPQTFEGIVQLMKSKNIKLESEMGHTYLADMYQEQYTTNFSHNLNNLEVGIYYLNLLLKDFDFNHLHATVAYNMGPSWTRFRIKNNDAVGVRNLYLSKVMKAYFYLARNLSLSEDIKLVQNP